jgi:plasmid stabilization system protein ParE
VKHIIRPAARDDIIRQFRYYLVDQDAPEVANLFLEAVQEAIEEILRMPGMGAPKHLSNDALAGLRSWLVLTPEQEREFQLGFLQYIAPELRTPRVSKTLR